MLTFGILWHPLLLSAFWHGPFWFYPFNTDRSILISVTCNLFSTFFLTVQLLSAQYVIIGLITVVNTLSFSLMGTFLSHSTPASCFHFIQASFTRLLMFLSAPPFESNPKCLNVFTQSQVASWFTPNSPFRD